MKIKIARPSPPQATSKLAHERGAIAVVVAILAVVLVGVSALAVDLGVAYSDRRLMQNASDAAATAGTRQLVAARWTTNATTPPSWKIDLAAAGNLNTLVADVITKNGGGNPADYACEVLSPSRSVLATCDTASKWDETAWRSVDPVGVRVRANSTRPSVLGGIFGSNSIRASAGAAAQVFPVKSGQGDFLVCAYHMDPSKPYPVDGNPARILLEDALKVEPAPSLPDENNLAYLPIDPVTKAVVDDWTYNPLAIGDTYLIHDPKIKKPCGLDVASWNGLAGIDPQGLVVPGVFGTDPGTKAGPTRVMVANRCADTGKNGEGCFVTAPICVAAWNPKTGSKNSLWCVKLGVFELTQADSNTHEGKLVSDALLEGAVPGTGTPEFFAPKTVQMVE